MKQSAISILRGQDAFDAAPVAAQSVRVGEVLPRHDIVELLLRDKRSEATRRAYKLNLELFFKQSDRLGAIYRDTPQRAVEEFLSWPPSHIAIELAEFKGRQIEAGYAEATVNQRLFAVRSLLKWAFKRGLSTTDGRGLVEAERVKRYRDTRGFDSKTCKKLIEAPLERKLPKKGIKAAEKSQKGYDLKALRDYAIGRLLFENGLRRSELLRLTVGDLSVEGERLWILGKGRGSQKESVDVDRNTAQLIATYMLAQGHYEDAKAPLFCSLDHQRRGQLRPISASGLAKIVAGYGTQIGLKKRVTPHMFRHSAITVLAHKTNGNMSAIQDFSRHADANTVRKYIDNANTMQGKLTGLLAETLR